MSLIDDFKEFVFKYVRYPKIYTMSDADVTSLFQRIVGNQEIFVDKGNATDLYLVWNNSTEKYEPLTLEAFKTALGTFQGIVEAGTEFNKYLVWNVGTQTYQPLSDAEFISNFFDYIESSMIFYSDTVGQNTPLLPCFAGMGVPVSNAFMLRKGSISLGDANSNYNFTITAQDKYFLSGQSISVEVTDEQDGTYLDIIRILANNTRESVYSAKVSALHPSSGAIVTLTVTPYIEPVGV